MNLTLSPDQDAALKAVIAFLANPSQTEMAISGPAGTGKTVLTRYILEQARDKKLMKMMQLLLNHKNDLNIALTSSTNKAANVLADATGEDAITIHKLLNLIVKNDLKTGLTKVVKTKNTGVIENTFIIIDEASMINSNLLYTIRSCTKNCKVLYIGDGYQLAPVRENIAPVFKEVTNQVKLTTIQRQVAGSPIIQFASEFREALDTNKFPIIKTHGTAIQHLSETEFQSKVDSYFYNIVDSDYARIISWTNSRVHQYNNYVRNLNFVSADYVKDELLITNKPIMEGDKRIFKGDALVRITDIKPGTEQGIDGWYIQLNDFHNIFQAKQQSHVAQLIKHYAKHKDWQNYFFTKDFFADLRPYFSSTIAKAQGSTYKNVFIDVTDIGRNTKNSEIARLMYTAITRASDTVFMRGNLPDRLYK